MCDRFFTAQKMAGIKKIVQLHFVALMATDGGEDRLSVRASFSCSALEWTDTHTRRRRSAPSIALEANTGEQLRKHCNVHVHKKTRMQLYGDDKKS